MKIKILYVLLLLLTLTACTKNNINLCSAIQHSKLTSNSPVTIGGELSVAAPDLGTDDVVRYSWTGPAYFNSPNPTDSISYAEPKNEGWYYLNITTADGSCEKFDSEYVQVNFVQGTPPCSIPANNITYNNLPTDIYSTITREAADPDFSELALTGTINTPSTSSTITIYFHPYWRTIEPRDGIYQTVQQPYDPTDLNFNEVSIEIISGGFRWVNYPNASVYISHVGSKLQVQFCDLTLSDENGSGITTIASGNLIEQ